jgi:hypothetical protein
LQTINSQYIGTLLEGGGALTSKDRIKMSADTVRERKLQFRIKKLLDISTLDIGRLDFFNADNVDGAETSTVACSHVLIYKKN